MVGELRTRLIPSCQLLAADALDKTQPLLYRLAPAERARVIMALLGMVLIGAGLVAIVLVAARRLRRIARSRPRPTQATADDWYRKPLVTHERQPDSPDSPPSDSA